MILSQQDGQISPLATARRCGIRGTMSFLSHPRFIRFAIVTFWIVLAGSFVMALLPKPPKTPLDQFGDKIEHMVAFMTLGGLAMIAYGKEARWRIVAWLMLVGALIEVVQGIPMLNRDSDVRDWIADTVAILVVVILFSRVVPSREPATG